jgi:hypothetical protein
MGSEVIVAVLDIICDGEQMERANERLSYDTGSSNS